MRRLFQRVYFVKTRDLRIYIVVADWAEMCILGWDGMTQP